MKNINYLNKTFEDFKLSLQNYIKTYYPNSFNDFTTSSPGNIFLDTVAYVGDVLSFYTDTQIQEVFLNTAQEKESLYNLAYTFGYKPQLSYASNTTLDIYQLVPVIYDGVKLKPDFSYSLIIPEGNIVTGINGEKFITLKQIDFSLTESKNISIYNNDFYILKQSVDVISAEEKSITLNFSELIKFNTFKLKDEKILKITKLIDQYNDIWYEVPYLAQDLIYISTQNPNYLTDGVENLLSFKKTHKRFTTRILNDNTLESQFGAGISNLDDEEIIPNLENLNGVNDINLELQKYNKNSFYFTKSYGMAPLGDYTLYYLVGGGLDSNIDSNTLTNLNKNSIYYKNDIGLDNEIKNFILSNTSCNNPFPSVGGKDGDSIEEIRLNTLSHFSTQNRLVNNSDYIIKSTSMPNVFGNISKAYISKEIYNNNQYNPLELDLYILSYDKNKKITLSNDTIKNNLKNYLEQYRIITDSINIKNAFYINIGINFEIYSDPYFNNKQVLINCLNNLKEHFNIDKWSINQPIYISDVYSVLSNTQGVKSIGKIEFINKHSGNYSPYQYDMRGATKNNIIYPSLDPSIFEIRYPEVDIQGKIISF